MIDAELIERLQQGVLAIATDHGGERVVYDVVGSSQSMRKAADRLLALSEENAGLLEALGQRDALIAETLGKLRIAEKLSDGEAAFWQRAADELEADRTALSQHTEKGDAK